VFYKVREGLNFSWPHLFAGVNLVGEPLVVRHIVWWFGQAVDGIIVLDEQQRDIGTLAAIVPSVALALDDVDPLRHKKSPAGIAGRAFSIGSPARTRITPLASFRPQGLNHCGLGG